MCVSKKEKHGLKKRRTVTEADPEREELQFINPHCLMGD
jgi:hypothetical protein